MADANGNGTIDFEELTQALRCDQQNNFRPETCRLMINMFDRSGEGTINPKEFEALWKYLASWRMAFAGYDKDGSGTIDKSELSECLTKLGYRLSDVFVQLAISRFDYDKKGVLSGGSAIYM